MLAIENGVVYAAEGTIQDGVVLIEGETIRAVGPRKGVEIPPGTGRVDAKGGHIAPGFVEMHTNGALGCDLLNATPADLEAMAKFYLQQGVTAFVPTIISASSEDILNTLELARQVLAGPRLPGAEILGVHIEGPYINLEMKGAHPGDVIRDPTPEEYTAFLEYSDIISWVTLAPELPGALELIRDMKSRGILVSAGHTLAIDRDVEQAVVAGLSHVTHLFCNMGTLRRENITRVAGMTESALLDDRLTAEIIGDGYTISPSLMKLAYKVKGANRLAIVTDASPLVGLPPGTYNLWDAEVLVEGDIVYLSDRSAFAGSMSTMDQCLRNAVDLMEVPLEDALRMISATPASILGLAHRKGSLAAGKDADVVVLNSDLEVTHAIALGRLAYSL